MLSKPGKMLMNEILKNCVKNTIDLASKSCPDWPDRCDHFSERYRFWVNSLVSF